MRTARLVFSRRATPRKRDEASIARNTICHTKRCSCLENIRRYSGKVLMELAKKSSTSKEAAAGCGRLTVALQFFAARRI